MNSAALHQAIYTRLAGFTALTSKLSSLGVMSRVPQPDDAGEADLFPYVTFKVSGLNVWDTASTDGIDATLQVDVWSRSQSDLQFKAILDSVYDCLHKFDLVISGANTVNCLFLSGGEFDDPDGVTVHGFATFRITFDGI
mgnify:FL=1